MEQFSATNTLTNYINSNSYQTSIESINKIEQNSINKQLNDLRYQFETGIKVVY